MFLKSGKRSKTGTERDPVKGPKKEQGVRGGLGDRHPFFIINQFPPQINANNKAGALTVVKTDRNTEAVIDRILTFQAVCVLSSSAKRPWFIDLIKQRHTRGVIPQ